MPVLRVFCLINRHRPVREEVTWTGLAHEGSCKRCGTAIRRLERGGWRRRKVRNAD